MVAGIAYLKMYAISMFIRVPRQTLTSVSGIILSRTCGSGQRMYSVRNICTLPHAVSVKLVRSLHTKFGRKQLLLPISMSKQLQRGQILRPTQVVLDDQKIDATDKHGVATLLKLGKPEKLPLLGMCKC